MSTIPSGSFAAVTLEGCVRAIEQALRAGNQQRAKELASAGAARGFAHPNLLVLAVHHCLEAGDSETALGYAEKARELAPRNPDVLNVYGLVLLRAGRAREALRAFDAGLRQASNAAVLHFNKGEALERLGQVAPARREFERVLEIQPNFPQAHTRLAYMAASAGDTAAAREHATRALKQKPDEVAAQLALSLADLEDCRFEEARARAAQVARAPSVTAINRSLAYGIVGDAEDGLGHPAQSFAAYTACNEKRREVFKPLLEASDTETASARAARLEAYFRVAAAEDWRADRSEPPFKPVAKSPLGTHVFLVGFPRSGTTLLEQILASHRDVETMEERNAFSRAIDDFIVAPDGLDRLAKLRGHDLDPWRMAYWQYAADFGVTPSRDVFIDKMPLNTVLLPLIAKLFPSAKVLFALRDPRDVVLSCFRRRFGMTAQMYELLTLNEAAAYYDAVMSLDEIYRDLFALETHVLKYEDMVADFEGATHKVCAFLGVEWDEGMRDFAEKTRTRAVDTPSAAQVARGLYTKGMGQWRAYREQMAPVLSQLAPWCAKFGYEED